MSETRTTRAATRLEIRRLRKVFGDTAALRSADLEVRAGEIHGLLGENGAGKSTLIKILAGLYEPDGGEVRTDGGLAFIHQDPVVFPDMTVAENIAFLTRHSRTLGVVRWRRVGGEARRVLGRLGIELDVRTKMATLPIAARTMVAIAAAIANEATTLVLDEPTASLSAQEVGTLFGLLHELRERGIAIVLVTHRIDEVMALCDRVTVLRDGATVGVERVADLTERELIRMIVGHEPQPASSASEPSDDPLLEVRGVCAEGVPGPVSFVLGRGEIVGLTGTLEAGHHAIGELIYGLRQPVRGTLTLAGEHYAPSEPRRALARGIRYLPADRNLLGLAEHLSLKENLFVNSRDRLLVGTRKEAAAAGAVLRRFDVRPPDPAAEVSTLSGGNAQKLLLARCFSGRPALVVLTEPTSGVDVGARAAIYEIIRNEAAAGVGVLVISSDFAEIRDVCDRCLVLRGGAIAAELEGETATVAQITTAAL